MHTADSRDFLEPVVRVSSTITLRFYAPSISLTTFRAGKSFPMFNYGKYRPEEITKLRLSAKFFSSTDRAIEIASHAPQALADHDGRGRLCRAISTAGNPPPEEERLRSERDVTDDGFVMIPRILHRRHSSFPRSSTSRRGSRGRNAADALARHFRRLELQAKFGILFARTYV